jgi:hypothetical protein
MPLSTLGYISIATINAAFENQIASPTLSPGILYRFLQVRAWELSGADISVSLLDFLMSATIAGDNAPIRTQHDQSGRNHWARVGCALPVTQQNDVCYSVNTTKNIFQVASGSSAPNVRVHLHILWRNVGVAQPETSQASLDFSKLLPSYSTEPDSPPETPQA